MESILFIAPPFYDYPLLIKRELEKRFKIVDCYYSSPTASLYRIVAFLHLNKIENFIIRKYNERILKEVKQSYDYVFVIKASVLGNIFLEELHKKVRAKYVEYLWDDIKFDGGAKGTIPYFDKIFSFSPVDCVRYNLILRTNFYDPIECNMKDKDIDLLFVGGYKPNRFDFIKKIVKEIEGYDLKLLVKIKCGFVLFMITPRLWKYKKFIIFHPLSYKEMMNLLSRSRVMVDIAESGQIGLTTRPFEAMGVKTKILTTNQKILEYDFYNETNFFVVDEQAPNININWIKSDFCPLRPAILGKYSIQSFIDDILG